MSLRIEAGFRRCRGGRRYDAGQMAMLDSEELRRSVNDSTMTRIGFLMAEDVLRRFRSEGDGC